MNSSHLGISCKAEERILGSESQPRELPGGPGVRARGFRCRGSELNPCLGNEDAASHVAGLKYRSQPDVALNLKMLLRLCSDKELMLHSFITSRFLV